MVALLKAFEPHDVMISELAKDKDHLCRNRSGGEDTRHARSAKKCDVQSSARLQSTSRVNLLARLSRAALFPVGAHR